MKISLFLMFICVFHLLATPGEAQNAILKLKTNSISVGELISEIEEQTDYLILYRNREVDMERTISVEKESDQVIYYLDKAFENTDVVYHFQNNYILLATKDSQIKNTALQRGSKVISGFILDDRNEPIIGANVREKGTTNGTITNLDGGFTLTVPEDAILDISYIGYHSQSVKVPAGDLLTVVMMEDNQLLDEVVIIGYGTQKKLNLTGAVSAVSGKELANRPVTNTASMLQGQIPGLRVIQNTGQPGGEGVSFQLRGKTSYGAGSDPLILINGVPGSMTNLDPSMVESISVLKDAASASIYGARAANGVILITTKQGSDMEGKVQIGYHGNYAVHAPTRMFDLVTNSADYMELFNLAKTNSGQGGLYPDADIQKYRNSNNSEQYPSFDWLDYMFNPAFVHQHNLSLAGTANNQTTYNLALNYVDQDGTLRTYNYKKYNMTIDLTTLATKWMRVGVFANLMKGDLNFNGLSQDDAILSTMSQAPTYRPWLPDDGTGVTRWTHKAYDFEQNNKNLVQLIDNDKAKQSTQTTDLNANVWFEVNFGKGLSWYTKGAIRQQNSRDDNWHGIPEQMYYYHDGSPSVVQGSKGLTVKESRILYTNLYTYLKYDVSTGNRFHNFSLMGGYSQETNLYQNLEGYRADYVFSLPTLDAGVGAPDWSNGGKKEEWSLMSGFFRANYNFKEKYLLEANARYDGTSRLSPDGRWGLFPSFSGAWRFTEENFLKDLNLEWFNNGKIRGSWGKLGNQDIGLYRYQAMIQKVDSYTFDKTNSSAAYMQTAYVNRDIQWETTTITNIGADLTFFNRLNVVFDWYRKETDGILRNAQISGLLGMGAPTINDGGMLNKGLEISTNWSDRIRGGALNGLDYGLGFFVSRNRNTLTQFGSTEMDGKVIRQEGLPYDSYYMLDCIGIFADQAEIDNSPKQFNDNTQPGDLKFRDVNGDGKIDNDDRVFLDGQYPGFEYSISAYANWKGFDVSLLGQGVVDKKYYLDAAWGEVPFYQGSAPTKDYVKHMWTEENPYNANYPKLYFGDMGGGKNTRTNSYFLKDASYFRLKNFTLGYTLPPQLTRKAYIERLRVYFSGENLLTFTKFKGLDPERQEDGRATIYPQNRICSFGINIDF